MMSRRMGKAVFVSIGTIILIAGVQASHCGAGSRRSGFEAEAADSRRAQQTRTATSSSTGILYGIAGTRDVRGSARQAGSTAVATTWRDSPAMAAAAAYRGTGQSRGTTVLASAAARTTAAAAVPGQAAALPAMLVVQPAAGLSSSGPPGGPFAPASAQFSLWNPGATAVDWTAGTALPWLSLSKAAGTLAAGGTDAVTVSLNTGIHLLPAGTHVGQVIFTNLMDDVGTTARSISLAVLPAAPGAPMTTASRASGVAPLAVFFDATQASSGVVQPGADDRAEFACAWDFGDPDSGHWSSGRRNLDGICPARNVATGFVAAHVFEMPGLYRVRLHVIDKLGQPYSYYQDITVQDPEAVFSGIRTLCVSVSGNFAGSPIGSLQAISSDFDAQMRWLLSAAGPRRVLLRSGETFSSSGGTDAVLCKGPYSIGRFGAGEKPVINSLHNDTILYAAANVTDLRMVDLELRGMGMGTVLFPGTQFLVLQCRLRYFSHGIIGGSRELTVANCSFRGQTTYGVFCAADDGEPPVQYAAFLGNEFDEVRNEHLLRTYVTRSVMTSNTFGRGAPDRHQLKFCGLEAPYKSEHCIISDNLFSYGGAGLAWMASIGPENEESAQAVDGLVIERNLWYPGVDGMTAIQSRGANNVTVRNNVFRSITAAIKATGGVPGFSTWTNWRVLNNTQYQPASPDSAMLISGGPFQRLRVCNNILSQPSGPTVGLVLELKDTPLTQLEESHNVWHLPGAAMFSVNGILYTLSGWQAAGMGAQDEASDPQFWAADRGDFRLGGGGVGYDTGQDSPDVRDDIERQSRPLHERSDAGAYERCRPNGDINGDWQTDVTDLLLLVECFGKMEGDEGFDPRADFDGDGGIGVIDLLIMVEDFGK